MIDSTLKNANILIVDDQEANIDVLEDLLKIQGYTQIKTTTDPREVVLLFISFKPDIILLDLSMPYLSGFEVMKQLKHIVPAHTYLPILVLTADITKEAKLKSLNAGASDFLTKPFDLIEVGLRIKNMLHAGYLQQQVQNQNQILEEKVKERTQVLEKTTIELKAAKEKAEESNRLKTAFLNNITHEIRTPLNGILGFGRLLLDGNLVPEENELYLSLLSKSSDRLIDTVNNFLDISLLNSGNQEIFKKEFNPEDTIIEAIKKFDKSCREKNINLLSQIPSGNNNYKIHTDCQLLSKILYQLIDNAVKFTNQGEISVGYKRMEDEFHFFVHDSGIGISEESKKTVFGSFNQENNATTRGHEGSGLGLSIAKGFVELLGGKIWLDSEKGKGSTFYFSIPAFQQIVPVNDRIKTDSADSTALKLTILVAEDNMLNFLLINLLLRLESIQIIHALNGREAVEICRKNPEIQLVLMDLKMPEMDGFEATSLIKSFRSDLPVIALTSYSTNIVRQEAKQAGCDDFLTKPVSKEILFDKLKEFGLF